MDDFGKNLKELRIAAGISQAELANQLYMISFRMKIDKRL